MTNMRAIDAGGSLRPPGSLHSDERSAADEEYLARLKAANSIRELFAVIESASPEPNVEIMDAVNESRRLSGFRMTDPQAEVPE
jgi:hypothetical protein